MKRTIIAFILGFMLNGGIVYAGFGWYIAKIKLRYDHKAGETVKCDTPWSSFKIVSCEEK